jgi:hypothetical protein
MVGQSSCFKHAAYNSAACLKASLLRPLFQALYPMTKGGRFEIETEILSDAMVRDVFDMSIDPA